MLSPPLVFDPFELRRKEIGARLMESAPGSRYGCLGMKRSSAPHSQIVALSRRRIFAFATTVFASLLLTLAGVVGAETIQGRSTPLRPRAHQGGAGSGWDAGFQSPASPRPAAGGGGTARGTPGPGLRPFSIGDGYVSGVRINELRSGRVQVVLDLERALSYKVLVLTNPHRLVVDVEHSGNPAPVVEPSRGEQPSREPVRQDPPPPRTTNRMRRRSSSGPWVLRDELGTRPARGYPRYPGRRAAHCRGAAAQGALAGSGGRRSRRR